MWLALLFCIVCSQLRDEDPIKSNSLTILGDAGFTKEDFDHLTQIYDNPDMQEQMAATKEKRDKELVKLYVEVKPLTKDTTISSDERINDELGKVEDFLDKISRANGNTLDFGSVRESEKEKIFTAIRKLYPRGAKSADDFKVFFNVMRAYVSVRGADHLEEDQKEAEPAPSPPVPEPKAEQHPVDMRDSVKGPTEMMRDHGHPESDGKPTQMEEDKGKTPANEKGDTEKKAETPTNPDAGGDAEKKADPKPAEDPKATPADPAANAEAPKANAPPAPAAKADAPPAPAPKADAPAANADAPPAPAAKADAPPAAKADAPPAPAPKTDAKPADAPKGRAANSMVDALDLEDKRVKWALCSILGTTLLIGSVCFVRNLKTPEPTYTLIEDEI